MLFVSRGNLTLASKQAGNKGYTGVCINLGPNASSNRISIEGCLISEASQAGTDSVGPHKSTTQAQLTAA